MENYTKARTEEQAPACPFPDLDPDTPRVLVKDGSKIRNLLRFALSHMEARTGPEEASPSEAAPSEEAAGRQLVFTASGKGAAKAITCAEIVKRRVRGVHQLTRLQFSRQVEVWEPLEPAAGLDSLTVSRSLPNIWILVSTRPLDAGLPGYQGPGRLRALWARGEGGDGRRRWRGGAVGRRSSGQPADSKPHG